MRSIILLTVTISAVLAEPATSSASTESTTKADSKSANAIPVQTQKPQTYYAMPVLQHRPPYTQYIQKPSYFPANLQHQPHAAMVIIAHPAIIPQQVLYNQIIHQLLNYFHNNPQARQQFLHSFQPQPTPAPYPQHQAYQYVAAPSHLSHSFYPPQQTEHRFVQHQHHHNSIPVKTAPPIITGFEHFTPDQQAQIKAQLSSHFGTQLSPISGNSIQGQAYSVSSESNSGSQEEEGSKSPQPSATASFYKNLYVKA